MDSENDTFDIYDYRKTNWYKKNNFGGVLDGLLKGVFKKAGFCNPQRSLILF